MRFVNFRSENMMESFFRLPRVLFYSGDFDSLSVEAKTLYCILLDRMSLSDENCWVDLRGQVYVYMGLCEIQRTLGCGHDKATRVLRELSNMGLIERVHQGLGKPPKIYVKQILDEPRCRSGKTADMAAEKSRSGLRKSRSPDCGKTAANYTEYI